MPDGSGPIQRREQAAIAGHLGAAAAARAHLDDNDPQVRATALRALTRTCDLTAEELQAALADPAHEVRIAALDLVVTRPDVAVAGVAALLDDTDSRVVEAAAWACGEKVSSGSGGEHGPRAAEPIARAAGSEAEAVVEKLVRVATTHDDALCRESAIAALGAIGDPRGLPAVLGGLDDKPAVRRRAVIALAPFDGPEVEAALERAGRDRDRQVRAAAAELGIPAAD